MAEAGLMITQAAMAPVWAWLADKYGRKRCVMYGFTGTVMSASMTGFGRSVWWIIFWRAMFGLSPSDVVHRVMLTERSHQSNRPRIFSLWSPIFNIGFVCGQLIGGFLASPHGRLPWIMGGQVETWKKWPYGLPCVVVGTLGLIALIVCKYMIEDDVPLALNQTGLRVSNNLQARVRATLRIPFFVGVRELRLTPNGPFALKAFQIAVYAHTGFLTVMSYTSIEHGGWGLSVASIGVLTSCLRTTYMLSTPLLLPHFVRRFSLRRRFRIALSALPLESLLIPISQLAARQSVHGQGSGEGKVRKPHRFWFWVVMLVEVPLYNLHMFAWPINDNTNTDCFDNYPALIATGSAITQITGAVGRATGPVLSG
ncbi:hypothetical protein I316_00460 [Kwoniella heveanensis BCC8398]|uniref:Major facilitator superfamily (MFS) profile domain-containing protein n=1 Tax=Kwoniella heveanensis BCC8398 TaxID=1296120 RepID=A0A1B9H4N4_9TREE|nr:hypothetical protein I316_00460 [Kwoniella heveanensis BCC8398]